jgi:predicted nucleic acid-binding protein
VSELVLDCSVTAVWLFEDETSPYAEAILDELAFGREALAPFVWPLEVSNVLLVGERRGRIAETQSAAFWETLKALPISVDERAPMTSSDAILALGREHGLSSYDAAYLELAVRNSIPIATLDERLANAAQASGTGVWQPQGPG